MSDTPVEKKLAGHPPAVKVGKVRVVQHKERLDLDSQKKDETGGGDEGESGNAEGEGKVMGIGGLQNPPSTLTMNPKNLGIVESIEKKTQPQETAHAQSKVYEKMPTHGDRPNIRGGAQNQTIQQPRRQN